MPSRRHCKVICCEPEIGRTGPPGLTGPTGAPAPLLTTLQTSGAGGDTTIGTGYTNIPGIALVGEPNSVYILFFSGTFQSANVVIRLSINDIASGNFTERQLVNNAEPSDTGVLAFQSREIIGTGVPTFTVSWVSFAATIAQWTFTALKVA